MANYYNRPKSRASYRVVEITPAKVLMIVGAVMIGFVIPVQLIEVAKQSSVPYTEQTTGSVAGATDVDYQALILQGANDLLADRTTLLTLGLGMIVVAIGLSIYLIYRLGQQGKLEADRTYQLDLTD
jgi:hypothetical protein